MISLFRNNLFINSLLLLPYIAILRLKSFFVEQAVLPQDHDSYLYSQTILLFDHPIAQAILSILIIFINSLIINRMVIKYNLAKEANLVSGLFYGLFCSILLDFIPISAPLLASPFILLSIQGIFNSYNNVKADGDIFLSGFFMSLAGLFYFPILYLLPFTFIGFIIMRSFKFQERIQHFIGWLVPFFLLHAWEYFIFYQKMSLPNYFLYKPALNFFTAGAKLSQFLSLIALIVMSVICVLCFNIYMSKKVIAAQKRINILYVFMLFSGISAFFFRYTAIDHIIIWIIPVAIMITMSLMEIKNQVWPEIVHLFLVLILVILHLDLIRL